MYLIRHFPDLLSHIKKFIKFILHTGYCSKILPATEAYVVKYRFGEI